MKCFKRLAALACLAIAGCGGGGGGNAGSGGDHDLSVGALTPAAVTATVSNLRGMPGRDVTLTASYSNGAGQPIYVAISDPDKVFNGAFIDIGATAATLHLGIDDNAAIGHYTQPFFVHLCRDEACTSEYPGFPRTIQKNLIIQGTTASVSALNFTSTAGVSPATQSIAVTPAPDADAKYDPSDSPYVDAQIAGGSSSLQNTNFVFTVTKTAGGYSVQANPIWAGHYTGKLVIETTGYKPVVIAVDYQVGAATTPVAEALTQSLSGASRAGSSADVDLVVDLKLDMLAVRDWRIDDLATGGSPDPVQTFWLRYWDMSNIAIGDGPADNGRRLRFKLNACMLGQNCLPAGRYTANIVVTPTAWEVSTPLTIPVTFDIAP